LVPKSLELIRTAKLSESRRQQLQRVNADLELQIGERKRIEEELSESEERFRSLFQNLGVGVTLSGPRGEALMCNPAAWRLLGVTENQLASSAAPEWQASYDDEEVSACPAPAQQISRVIASRQPVRDAMLSVQRPDGGDRVWLLVSSEPQLATDGSVSTVISTFLDITHRKLAEDAAACGGQLFGSQTDSPPGRIFDNFDAVANGNDQIGQTGRREGRIPVTRAGGQDLYWRPLRSFRTHNEMNRPTQGRTLKTGRL